MKKIDLKAFSIRFLTSLFSLVLSELGIGCYYACGLGTDPISVFVDGLHMRYGLSYGTISTICNVIQTILIFLFIRKYLGIATLLGVLLGGPLIDVFETLVRTSFPLETTSLMMRCVILAVGLITTGIGYGLGIAARLGVGCFQFIPLFLAEKTPLELRYTQIISDALFFVIGYLLGGIVGVGTLVGVFLTGPILSKTLELSDPYIEALGPILHQ